MRTAGQKGSPVQAGQYYLMEKIAQGGMAEIFKGLSYDVHGLKKTVCIKKILPHLAASKEFIDSLIDEAKLAVKLVHGNIAQTFDLGKVGDDYFMVMEYVDGRSLSQIHKKCMAKGELIPIPYLVYFASEVLNGLNYMHRRTDENGAPLHIVHRDISPQNIMVSYSGTVKIIDFGIAKAAFIAGPTDTGILKGKFAYMSPEQAHGDAIDARSDVFSIGIILHEMLTGKRLFKADDSRETIRNVRRAKVSPPSSQRPELPDELDRMVLKALEKDRRHRYLITSEMSEELVKFLHTNYPDFKPSDAANFVHELFKDELQSLSGTDTDSKTPHLIIDRSNSALANDSQFESTGIARSPLDMSEYMLEETDASKNKSETHSVDEEKDLPRLEPLEDEEKTTPKLYRSILKKQLPITIAIVLIFAAFLVYKNTANKQEKAPPEASATAALPEKPVTPVVPAKKAPVQAKLEITTEPAGATIFINDRETSHRTPATMTDLPPEKETSIGLYVSGYKFWAKKIKLASGETRVIDVTLAKDFGSFVIESNPEPSLVMIDGTPAGQTPLTRDNLEPDRVYKIEVWHEGYRTFSTEMKANAGRKEDIRAVLEPEPKPPPESKPESTPETAPAGKPIDTPAPIETK